MIQSHIYLLDQDYQDDQDYQGDQDNQNYQDIQNGQYDPDKVQPSAKDCIIVQSSQVG